ncbi:MAG: tartrate dehydrogenase [Anaerolineaceae bacterium]|nr:MAG: tartrate dehydrogenase [Anaerolineaceae bacterium]
MENYQIAVIPGDGIGKEVMPEGVKVLEAAAQASASFKCQYTYFPWGCEYYLSRGSMMEKDALKILEKFDAIYFGAVGFPSVPDSVSLRGMRLAICQGFDQYANIRPAVLLPGIQSPLAGKGPEAIDFIVIRENTEGEYCGVGGRAHRGLPIEVAVQSGVFSRVGIERVIRFAFQLAQKRRGCLVSATKSNALEHAFELWDEVFAQVGLEFPDVNAEQVLVDALAARFVLRPESLDVVVASNLFADILTDLGAALAGSLGMAPTANLNPERMYPSMFEPIHGSAPDIYGRQIANPVGMIWSGALMMDFLGQHEVSKHIVAAIRMLTGRGQPLTPDIGGSGRTFEVGNAVAQIVRESFA